MRLQYFIASEGPYVESTTLRQKSRGEGYFCTGIQTSTVPFAPVFSRLPLKRKQRTGLSNIEDLQLSYSVNTEQLCLHECSCFSAGGEDAISFVISVFSLLGMLGFVTYTVSSLFVSEPLSSLPLSLSL